MASLVSRIQEEIAAVLVAILQEHVQQVIQRQVPAAQKLQRTVDVPQVQYIDGHLSRATEADANAGSRQGCRRAFCGAPGALDAPQLQFMSGSRTTRGRLSQKLISLLRQRSTETKTRRRRRSRPRTIWRIAALLRETPLLRKSSSSSLKLETRNIDAGVLGTGWTRIS